MSQTVKETQAIAGMTELFYSFLPGAGNSDWPGHVSFRSVAEKIGVLELWQEGSKRPMIAALLERTLTQRRGKFEALVLEIVKAGIIYRQRQKKPVTFEEVEELNRYIVVLGFKFPDLWDSDFLAALPQTGANRARAD